MGGEQGSEFEARHDVFLLGGIYYDGSYGEGYVLAGRKAIVPDPSGLRGYAPLRSRTGLRRVAQLALRNSTST